MFNRNVVQRLKVSRYKISCLCKQVCRLTITRYSCLLKHKLVQICSLTNFLLKLSIFLWTFKLKIDVTNFYEFNFLCIKFVCLKYFQLFLIRHFTEISMTYLKYFPGFHILTTPTSFLNFKSNFYRSSKDCQDNQKFPLISRQKKRRFRIWNIHKHDPDMEWCSLLFYLKAQHAKKCMRSIKRIKDHEWT